MYVTLYLNVDFEKINVTHTICSDGRHNNYLVEIFRNNVKVRKTWLLEVTLNVSLH